MTYKWKLDGLYSVPAQDAGAELERICDQRGGMEAADIVDESRPETAVLHPCFEWDDPTAAEKWREQQARNLCCCLVAVEDTQSASAPVEVRAFVHVGQSYQHISVVVNDEEKYAELEATVLRELRAIVERNRILADRPALKALFSAIDAATA